MRERSRRGERGEPPSTESTRPPPVPYGVSIVAITSTFIILLSRPAHWVSLGSIRFNTRWARIRRLIGRTLQLRLQHCNEPGWASRAPLGANCDTAASSHLNGRCGGAGWSFCLDSSSSSLSFFSFTLFFFKLFPSRKRFLAAVAQQPREVPCTVGCTVCPIRALG